MLKQFPNSGLNPGLFNVGPQLSPQQIAMLSQLPQIPQFQLVSSRFSSYSQKVLLLLLFIIITTTTCYISCV